MSGATIAGIFLIVIAAFLVAFVALLAFRVIPAFKLEKPGLGNVSLGGASGNLPRTSENVRTAIIIGCLLLALVLVPSGIYLLAAQQSADNAFRRLEVEALRDANLRRADSSSSEPLPTGVVPMPADGFGSFRQAVEAEKDGRLADALTSYGAALNEGVPEPFAGMARLQIALLALLSLPDDPDPQSPATLGACTTAAEQLTAIERSAAATEAVKRDAREARSQQQAACSGTAVAEWLPLLEEQRV